jgi:putative heme-binding domain-containing protein
VFRIEEEGAGFALKEEEPRLVSTNIDFRPVDVKIGPDGAIYVADWYNPIIGHYQNSFRDPRRDKAHGRIWRISAKGRPLAAWPHLMNASTEQLVHQIKSSERWVRYQTKRMLAERDPSEIALQLDIWLGSLNSADPLYERHLMEALSICETLDLPKRELLRRLLTAKDARARAYATEVVGRWQRHLPEALSLLERAAMDEHPRVRLQAVVAAGRVPNESSIDVALAVTDKPVDRFLNDALIQSVHALKPYWLPAFTAGRSGFLPKANRLEFLLKTDGSADTLRATVERLKDFNLDRATRGGLLRVLADVGGPNELAVVFDAASYSIQGRYDPALHGQMLSALALTERLRRVRPPGDLTSALKPLILSPHHALRSEAMKVAGVWKLEPLRATLETAAEDKASAEGVRMAAIEGIGALRGDASRQALLHWSTNAEPTTIRAAAVIHLARIDLVAGATSAAEVLQESSLPDETVTKLFAAFLQRKQGAAALVTAFGRKAPPADAAKLGLREMSAAGRSDEALASVLAEAAGLNRESFQLGPEDISLLAQEVRIQADSRRGAEVYSRPELSCAVCHAIDGTGGDIGPDLSSLGTAQPIEFILGAVLDPNKEVKEGYNALEITTKTGDIHQGYIVRESAEEVVMRDIGLKEEVRLRKESIASRVQRGSVMPPGLANTLTRSELSDLIRFLSQLGRSGR